jgi:MFS transporter, DHA2 family, glioxin efflux transporter
MLGTSAQESGIRNLALIIAVSKFVKAPIYRPQANHCTSSAVCVIASGGGISALGYFAPFLTLGAAITTAGAGLIYTFKIDSPSSVWIGYQALAGIGIGACFQAPIMVGQALAAPEDVSATTAILLFFQTMGGAFMVSAAQAGFANRLIERLATDAPGVNPMAVVVAGATELRHAFTAEQLPGILASYMAGLQVAFTISVALAGCATVVSLGMPWMSVKGKQMTSAA